MLILIKKQLHKIRTITNELDALILCKSKLI
ncbi:hypothetical protein PANA5342_1642 [Pantoea ananatis LMG 5342]|nr:hypothetical protein PANA5342_1642 [Pantoea ananatis LMG 5342]